MSENRAHYANLPGDIKIRIRQAQIKATYGIGDILTSITDHLDVWTSAETPKKAGGRGRGAKTRKSPHGIKKLRELILELAVRGKLIPQDPNDEPASVLLEKIATEKEQLLIAGKIKKQRSLAINAFRSEKSRDLPKGWEEARFGNIVFNRDAERIPLSVGERAERKGEYEYYGASGVIDSINDYLFDEPLLLIGEDGANLINRSTPIAFIARGKYWVNNHAHVLGGLTEGLLLYVCLHINAINLEPYITGTAQPKMNQAKMNSILLSIPPMSEQHRIVAKVDELMALCDVLEREQTDSSEAHKILVETLLTTLTQAEDNNEFREAWSRIAEHFDTLFTTEQSIDQLKQTILQLAVMGKLVPPACRQAGKTPDSLPQPGKRKWFVYVIECEDGSFYKGFTQDLPKRWKQHCLGIAADWTKSHKPKQVYYWEQYASQESALKREKYLKSGSGREWFKKEVVDQPDAWLPASELLKKITAEKNRLIKEKKIKKQKPLPPVNNDKIPFELPEGWGWSSLGRLSSDIHYGYTASAQPENQGTRLLRITDIQDDKVDWDTVPGCEITDAKSEGYLLENNDVLIARTGGTIGKSYLVESINVKAVFASYLIRVKRISSMYSPYIKTYLGSAVYWTQLYDNASGTGQPNVNATALKQLLVPIPPIREQQAIVAKVDELMVLCDALKSSLKESQTTQVQLADAIVEQAVG